MSKRSKSKRMTRWIAGGAGVLAAAAVTNALCADTSDPLLSALIKKGILTEQEANDIKAESQTNVMASSASKWKLSNSIKEIGLFGDVRFRYEYRGVDNFPGASPSTYYRERFRYAFRAGIRGDLFDDFNYGVRLETSANPRSPWVTFGDDSSPTPSAKTSDGIAIGQIFLGWHPASWYEMTVGKMPQPLYTTPMVWDSDINPEGAYEKFKATVGNADLFAAFGQFVYQDQNPDRAIPSSDTWLLSFQLGGTYHIDKDSSFKIAPVLYTYAGRGVPSGGSGFSQLSVPFVGQGSGGTNLNTVAFNQNGINDLLVLEVPAEYNLKLGAYHARVFGDFAYNFEGDNRARAAFNAGFPKGEFPGFAANQPPTGENMAYQVGFGFGNEGPVYGPTQGLVYGSTSKKRTWEARVYWQHVEQYALDVNLMDSDFFEGRANLEGIYAAFAYSFTDAIIGTVRYGYASRINSMLGTGGNNLDLPALNPINNYNLVQLDLTWRF
ncbi:MAG TPA: putative porin [Verrucomicrobiae bacterium]|nr:putative porin [Verrucomicrobiae bacterium]